MNKEIPKTSKVVVIGGGVVGCSVAYHLAKFGWKDTILLERDQLTSGTTWHAAGLVSQLGPSAAITKIRKYSLDLYKDLEKKVDHSAGLRLNGALSIAQNKERWQELLRQATTAQLYDVDVRVLDKDQIKKDYPIINTDEILGGIFMPGAEAPKLVTKDMIKLMKRGSVIVDVAIDQGGCVETSKPTTHGDPTYIVDEVVHYCVANMPGGVPRTSTIALNNATLPFLVNLANKGYQKALGEDKNFLAGLNVYKGDVTYKAVADVFNYDYVDPSKVVL